MIRKWRLCARAFRSKSRNTPFDGWDLTGKVVATFVGGALVYEDRPAAAPLRVAS
jgi:dihydroorotase